MQRLQDTDGFIMIEFANATRHMRDASDDVLRVELPKVIGPYMRRLKANGHEQRVAVSILAETFVSIPRKAQEASV